ncbi:hypothetical protein CN605_27960 [Bacillus toyonensis]|uniref:hypothetical protein n=1 Tax=Bacillus toyonensis TaxID=155322 RepID=UPI000BF0CA30|nr:hypothetical protein [Bacillus toyonensis]PEL35490.1 hypothetical protein CN605_27960 [Bacillus toyonensis]
MSTRVYFSDVLEKISIFINDENIDIDERFLDSLLRFLSKVCNYEEEEIKIRPKLILTKNIEKVLKSVPYHSQIKRGKGKKDGEDFNKMIKAIMPFCNMGWYVYVDFQEDEIEYGIIRSFSGPKGLTLTETLYSNLNEEGVSIVEISVASKYEIDIHGISQEKLIIDFRLVSEDHLDVPTMIESMSEDIVSQIDDQETREKLGDVFKKLLKLPQDRVHGTICIVVDHNYSFPNESLSDGIWFDKPIGLSEAALYSINETKDIYLGERYYGLSGLFIEMMNMDGITVIDNQGNVRGFNVFINKEIKDKPGTLISGGARKRAFYSLLETKDPGIIGVYFQSQDGEIIYERMRDYRER